MQSKATTVAQYLAELPPERRAAINAVRRAIRSTLDPVYKEVMSYGAIGYVVPHRVFPPGYHCDPKLPLPFAGLGVQKNHMSVGFMCSYGDPAEDRWLREAFARAGKKLDMGRCCIRFKSIDDLPLDVIAEFTARHPAKEYIARYSAQLVASGKGRHLTRGVATEPGKKVTKKVGAKATKKKVARKTVKTSTTSTTTSTIGKSARKVSKATAPGVRARTRRS